MQFIQSYMAQLGGPFFKEHRQTELAFCK